MPDLVRLDGVSKVFRKQASDPGGFFGRLTGKGREEFWAMRDVTLHIPRGQSVGIEGPNGSGKSTLLKVVAGTLQPTAGTVDVNGSIAPILQVGAGFLPRLSGRENVMLAAALLGIERADARRLLPKIVEFAELANWIHEPLIHYSAGMASRLGFATSIHLEADLLLVDEALAVGDAAFQAKCHAAVKERQAQGVSLLLVSHQPETIRQFCQRHVRLSAGRIVADEPL